MPRMVCRVVCGLLEVIATLLPDQRVGQRRLAGVGPADEAGEARPELGAHDACLAVGGAATSECRPRRRGRGRARPRRGSLGARAARSRWRSGGGDPAIRSAVSRSPATSPATRDRHPADGLAEQAADGVDLVLLEVDVEQLGEVVDVHRRGHPERAVRRAPRRRAASRSYSSAISPTISSRMSSMVTRPAVPPYSSTTTATWSGRAASRAAGRRPACSRARSDRGRIACVDRHRRPQPASALTPAGHVLEVEHAEHVVRPVADDRDPGEARSAGTATSPARRVLSGSMVTMSVRGTMTSRTTVSPSSKTEWIISRSPASISAVSPARSTRSRSSASDSNGPSRKPRPGVTALPSATSSRASGPSTRRSQTSTGAATSATRSACWRPRVRGLTPDQRRTTARP